ALLGKSETAARLVPAVAALLTILATFMFAARVLGPRAGFLSALVLTLTTGFIQCGRFIVLDSVLTFFITASLFAAYEGWRGPPCRRAWWRASAVCCGLAVLTKGPVAFVLLLPPVVVHAWLTRSPARPTLLRWAAFVGVVAAVAGPWFVAITVRDPNFF